MDGTLIDSAGDLAAAWEAIAKDYPGGLNVAEILSCEYSVTYFDAYNVVVCSVSWNQDRR